MIFDPGGKIVGIALILGGQRMFKLPSSLIFTIFTACALRFGEVRMAVIPALLLSALTLATHMARAEDAPAHDPYPALVNMITITEQNLDPHMCKVAASVDFEAYQKGLEVFRDAWLNKDYSVDFYAQRSKQVLLYIVLKHAAEILTEGFYNGHDMPECHFSLRISYPDQFGQTKSLQAVIWRFNNEQARKVNWEKFDPKDFNEVALDYEFGPKVSDWASDEPSMGDQKQTSPTEKCDMFMFRANAIFIRATTFCQKNYLDSDAGYAAQEGARKCATEMGDRVKGEIMAAMKSLDSAVHQRGRANACRMVEEVARQVIDKRR